MPVALASDRLLYQGIPLECYVYNAKSSTEAQNPLDQALALVAVANQYSLAQAYDQAKSSLELSLRYVHNSLASDRDQIYALVQIAQGFQQAQDQDHAQAIFSQAEQLLPQIFGRDQIFSQIALAEGHGDAKGLEFLDQAVAAADRLSDPYVKARALAAAAQVYGQMPGAKARSKELVDRDLELVKTFTNPAAASRVELELATTYAQLGETDLANQTVETAIQALNDPSGLIRPIAYDYLASAYLSVNNLPAARNAIAQMPDGYGKLLQLAQLAQLEIKRQELKSAKQDGETSLAIAEQLDQPERQPQALSLVAPIYRQLGKTTKAVELLNQGISLALRLENTLDRVNNLVIIAQTFHQIGQPNRAKQLLDQTYEIAKQAERVSDRPSLIDTVATSFGLIGDYDRALDITRGTPQIPLRNQKIRLYECAGHV
ncbi:MAG: hypothetical protein SFT94_12690 [Pseudanabaenaceae cyanobacterium bins.68]|nr:hypothetical protein [Pseudanabaenaceae cyanobacterium bins.68]